MLSDAMHQSAYHILKSYNYSCLELLHHFLNFVCFLPRNWQLSVLRTISLLLKLLLWVWIKNNVKDFIHHEINYWKKTKSDYKASYLVSCYLIVVFFLKFKSTSQNFRVKCWKIFCTSNPFLHWQKKKYIFEWWGISCIFLFSREPLLTTKMPFKRHRLHGTSGLRYYYEMSYNNNIT